MLVPNYLNFQRYSTKVKLQFKTVNLDDLLPQLYCYHFFNLARFDLIFKKRKMKKKGYKSKRKKGKKKGRMEGRKEEKKGGRT